MYLATGVFVVICVTEQETQSLYRTHASDLCILQKNLHGWCVQ